MEAFLTDVGPLISNAFTWITTVGTTIVATPLLMLGVGFFIVRKSVGVFKKLLGTTA